jgi:hypothetical protein
VTTSEKREERVSMKKGRMKRDPDDSLGPDLLNLGSYLPANFVMFYFL